jgi:chromosome segregation ATPase
MVSRIVWRWRMSDRFTKAEIEEKYYKHLAANEKLREEVVQQRQEIYRLKQKGSQYDAFMANTNDEIDQLRSKCAYYSGKVESLEMAISMFTNSQKPSKSYEDAELEKIVKLSNYITEKYDINFD